MYVVLPFAELLTDFLAPLVERTWLLRAGRSLHSGPRYSLNRRGRRNATTAYPFACVRIQNDLHDGFVRQVRQFVSMQ